MAIVWNPTQEKINVRIVGKWFAFAPGQRKNMQDEIAHFIATDKKETGLAVLPPQFEEDASHEQTPEGKALMERLREEAISHLVRHHRGIIANNQISLRQDLERANVKADPAVFASDGELESMRLVARYQRAKQDTEQAKLEQVRELMKEVNKK